MEKVTLTINGKQITAEKGATVLEAALANGIYIPNLCNHPDLEPSAVCRLCMVQLDNGRMSTSCNLEVTEGMVIKTESPEIDNVRRISAELLIADHHAGCLQCPSNNNCKLQEVAAFMGIDIEHIKQMRRSTRSIPIDHSNPFFDRNLNRCVLCGICVKTCEQITQVSAIDFANRGYDTKIATYGDGPMKGSTCVSCGECVVRCPVAALAPKKYIKPTHEVKTICLYCGVGCGLLLGVRGDDIVSVQGDRDNPVNYGRLCVKGRYGSEFINHPERLKAPLIKKNGEFVEATWDEALGLVAKKFSENKGEKFAGISSAKCTNEENYLVQKFTRAVMGTNNIDHCARLCHAPSVAGLAQSFGSGAMTNSIEEIANAACIFAIGTNTTVAHPIIALEMKKAVRNGGKMIVANPKEIDLCEFADIFLQHRPGTDVALMMGIMRVIVDEGLTDEEFIKERCENFEAFKESLAGFTPEFVEKTTGVPWDKIAEAAKVYAENKPAAIFYAMGITQHTHGTDNVLATSNLALLTGNVGKPSTGVNPLRGQNNVQGACDMAALPNVYPGYQKVGVEAIQQKFEKAWGVKLSDKPGLTHTEIFDAIYDGKITALYMVGENPVLSEANSSHVEEALEKIDFCVVQDIFLTESAKFADVVLPAATFAEKNGTFTNTERRIQRVRKALEPVGGSKPDWQITCELAKRMGAEGFEFADANEIMEEISELTPSYHGISYDRIEEVGLQWPCLDSDHPGTKFLHSQKFATSEGKGKFMPLEYKPPVEGPDDEYPLVLTTDRSLYHFHTSTVSRKTRGLEILDSEELLKINPLDAENLGLEDGEMVYVMSRRGKVKVRTNVTNICPAGVVSMTFHFFESPTNRLTNCAIDPVAKIPETKVCAVRVEKLV